MTFAEVLGPTPFFLFDQSDIWIQVYCDLIGYIEENGQLNNMVAGPKIWHKSPDPTQQSGWGLSTRLAILLIIYVLNYTAAVLCCQAMLTIAHAKNALISRV